MLLSDKFVVFPFIYAQVVGVLELIFFVAKYTEEIKPNINTIKKAIRSSLRNTSWPLQ